MIVHALAAQAQGPPIPTLEVADAQASGGTVVRIPGGTFQEYVSQELPVYLAGLVGEDVGAWHEQNQELEEEIAELRQRMEHARRNLARLGESQLRPYDQRGMGDR